MTKICCPKMTRFYTFFYFARFGRASASKYSLDMLTGHQSLTFLRTRSFPQFTFFLALAVFLALAAFLAFAAILALPAFLNDFFNVWSLFFKI